MKKTFPSLCLIFAGFLLSAETAALKLGGKEDFGSGSIVQSSYYPGGLGGRSGLMAGHPNQLTRRDRILMRFNLGRLYLTGRTPEIISAKLILHLWYLAGPKSETRIISVHALDYETLRFSANDLSNENVTFCGSTPAILKKHPPQGRDGRIEFDVTDALQAALQNNRLHAAFRISDSAEEKGNNTGGPVTSAFQAPGCGGANHPVLLIEYN